MVRIFQKTRVSKGFTLFLFLLSFTSFSQNFFGQPLQHIHDEKCAHTILEKMQEDALGIYGSKDFFETWVSDKIEEISQSPTIKSRIQNQKRVIPVVVHVIHRGENIGQGTNISLSQIQSQIRTLNEDFRRQNPDVNLTPLEFQGVAADANIEFVLATVDPRGFPTNGIVRAQGPKNVYDPRDPNDPVLISETSSWPPEDYFNMWVAPLQAPFIGYASFPVSNLPGLNFAPTARELDGVTVDYRYFGQGGAAVSGSRGRTLTHEVGHFLGLRHVWGDAASNANGCDVDDFVADTPNQDADNNTCRINNPRFSCGSRDMTENYMDYTPDACMNLFTQGQVERMNVVLEFSPRRGSLINNFATQDPNLPDLDLSLENIIDPQDLICSNDIVPTLELLNRGINTISSATVEIRLNGNLLQSRNFSLNLTTGQSTLIDFNAINLSGNGQDVFEASITRVNGRTGDDNLDNNRASSTPILQPEINIPFALDLASSTGDWIIRNPDNSFTWERITLPISGSLQNLMRIRNYEYEETGELDFFISPSINLNEFPNAQLTFNMAHAPFTSANFSDVLYVAISTDCGNSFSIIDAPYNKDRNLLQTSTPTQDEFIPSSNTQFRREIVNLAPFNEFENVRIAFISRTGFGNNIYLKDIEILENEVFRYKIDLNRLVSPGPINDGTQVNELVQITNTGNLPISSFILNRITNNGSPQSFVARGTPVNVGQSINVELPNSLTSNGLSRVQYNLLFPNFDQNPGNESELVQFNMRNINTVAVPWRQNFNGSTNLQPWTSVNTEGNENAWDVISLQGETQNNLIRLDGQNSFQPQWVGSPKFNLSGTTQASIFYSLAASNQSPSTVFKVMVSDNGGVNYREVSRKTGEEINTINSGTVNPNNRSDFNREFVNLTEFTGSGKTSIRVAFVIENGAPSNDPVFINDIELFLSANPDPVDPGLGNTIIYPNPARDVFNIAFNFENRESVNIQVISSNGSIVQDIDYPNTLNQTYSFSTQLFSKGLFIVKITSNSITETRRLIIH